MKEFTQKDFQSLMDWLSDEQKEKLSSLSDDQAIELLDTLRQEQSKKSEMYGKEDLLIEDLKKKHVKVEEKAKMEWHEWKIVHIYLPAKWDFKWFEFDFFVSEYVNVNMFMVNEWSSYSMKEISGLFWAINSYMKASWVDIDWDIDYEKELKYRERKNNKWCSEAWKIFKEITGLENSYFLKDRDDENNTIVFYCGGDDCWFFRDGKDGVFPSTVLYKQSN
jgi:hypothetical protein